MTSNYANHEETMARLPDDMPRAELLLYVGSTMHGIGIGNDDTDLMGFCIEPVNAIFGFEKFEQYEWRSANKRSIYSDGGKMKVQARSGPDDIDLVLYGFKKFMHLMMQNNPTILNLLYAPEGEVAASTRVGAELREEMKQYIVSQRARDRFVGYLMAQRQRALEDRGSGHGAREGRMEKWASHMVRLGFQGAELVRTGSLTIPMPEEEAVICRAVKTGDIDIDEALNIADVYCDMVKNMDSPLREEPDYDTVQKWMGSVYLDNLNSSRR